MEISPVSAVRMAPMIRAKESDLGTTDIFQTEYVTRLGDESYSPSVTQAASGFEDEEDPLLEPDELDDQEDYPIRSSRARILASSQFRFVA